MSNSVNKDLRTKTNAELKEIIAKLKTQLLEIRFAAVTGQTEKQANAKEIRKTIARVLTILNQRELEAK